MSRGPGSTRRALAAVLVAGLCLSAGCATLLGSGARTPYDVPSTSGEASRSPVAETTASPDDPVEGTGTDVATGNASGSRYFGLRPNCERPPSLVVAIQLGALANDGPEHRGIRTTYAFAAPSNRRAVGPLPAFVELLENGYQPLLDAERVAYGPFEGSNTTLSTNVTVTGPNGTGTSYRWTLERQTRGKYEGCWMTVGVTNVTDPLSVATRGN